MKDQKYYIKDNRRQGQRTDIQKVKESIIKGDSFKTIVSDVTTLPGIIAAEKLFKYLEPSRPVMDVEVTWIYGKSRTGKTSHVYKNHKEPFRPISYKWWDSYDGDQVVLIDDFRPDWCTFVNLLGLTDRYPFRVECKGGSRQALFTKIYITSIYSPYELYQNGKEPIEQLINRIKYFYFAYIDKNGDYKIQEKTREALQQETRHSEINQICD